MLELRGCPGDSYSRDAIAIRRRIVRQRPVR